MIGDDKYGEPSDPIHRLGLHAYEIAFVNPLNGKAYDIEAPMPDSFKGLFFRKKGKDEEAEKQKKALDAKAMRPTRSQTKIDVGKKRRAAQSARFGQGGRHGKR